MPTHLPKSTLRKLFSKRREFLQEQLAREQKTLKSFDLDTGPMSVAGHLMVDLCIQMFETELKWIRQAELKMLGR